MKIRANDLPSSISIVGNFDPNSEFRISEESLKSLSNNSLSLRINNIGSKPTIMGFKLSLAAIHGNIQINVGHDNANVDFQKGCSGTFDLRLWRDSRVYIGEGTTSNGTKIICDRSEFIAGRDCLFSDGILIQSADQHGIVDLNTGTIINNKKRMVVLSDHVWLGRNCTLMPDISIGEGSIIATGSVVTKSIPEQSAAAGVPAIVKRTAVSWSRAATHLDEQSISLSERFQALNKIGYPESKN